MNRTLVVVVLVVLAPLACVAQTRPGPRRMPGPPPGPLFEALDTDGNGTLSENEWKNAAEQLGALDRDGDHELTRDEIAPRRRGRHRRHRQRPGLPEYATKPPTAVDKAEKRILAVLDDLDRNNRHGNMNVPVEDGRLLRLLVEAIGARRVVEIGTSNGYSGIWICLGLRKTGGKLTTFEIDARRAARARKNFERAGVAGRVELVEGDAHEKVADLKGPVDLVFIDADKEGYPDYLAKLLPKVRPGGLILAHNMAMPRGGIEKYAGSVTTDKKLETLFVHMQMAGISVTLKKR